MAQPASNVVLTAANNNLTPDIKEHLDSPGLTISDEEIQELFKDKPEASRPTAAGNKFRAMVRTGTWIPYLPANRFTRRAPGKTDISEDQETNSWFYFRLRPNPATCSEVLSGKEQRDDWKTDPGLSSSWARSSCQVATYSRFIKIASCSDVAT